LVKLFKQRTPVSIIALIVFGFLINVNLFLQPINWQFNAIESSHFYEWIIYLLQMVSGGNSVILTAIYTGLAILGGFSICHLINHNKILGGKNLLPGYAFLLLIGLFNKDFILSPAFFASFFIILALHRLFQACSNDKVTTVFDIGFFVGMAGLIFPPSILLLIAVLIGLLIIRIFSLKEWLIATVAAFMPFYFMLAFQYFINGNLVGFWQRYNILPNFRNLFDMISPYQITVVLTLFLLTGLTVFFTQSRLLKTSLEIRKFLASSIWFLIIGTLAAFGLSSDLNRSLLITAVPLSILLAYFFINVQQKRVDEVLSFSIIAIIVVVQYLL